MLARVMGTPNPDRPGGGGEPPKIARSLASCSSLNNFVVSHQTPSSHAKSQRGPGLPKARQRGSTGNLVAAGLGMGLGGEGHRHRFSCDIENGVGGGVSHMTRASSASQELAAHDWLDGWKSSSSAMSPIRAPQPPNRPTSTHSGPPSLETSALASSRSSTDTAEGTSRQEAGPIPPTGFPSMRQPEAPKRRFIEDTSMQEEEGSPGHASLGVPVFVMMPLDTVNSDGVFRHASSRWFQQALESLAASGVHGIAIDVWWGAVERSPQTYDWEGYRQVFELAKSFNLKIQVVLSFHACGGNVGDSAQIPLPKWVLEAGDSDPDLFFLDRPRESRGSLRNTEYISFWADEAPGVVCGRSPLECYTDFMRSFRDAFADDIGEAIEDVVIGCGPCGELRYASYPEINNWRFPGVGEFQCYDRRALSSLAQRAKDAGHPEWGRDGGPHDAGEYNSNPEETGFFCCWGGSWDTPYGHFFLEWYAKSLVDHGERLLRAASTVFNFRLPTSRLKESPRGAIDARPRSQTVDQVSPSSGGNGTGMSECDSPGTQGTEGQAGDLGSLRDDDSQMTPGDRSLNASTSSFQGLSHAASRSSLMDGSALVPPPDAANASHLASQSQNSDSSQSLWPPPRLKRAGQRYDGKSVSLSSLATAGSERPPPGAPAGSRSEDARRSGEATAQPLSRPVGVTLKVAGVHWWYRTRAHAAELTAGYFNSGERDGYREIIELCARYNASFTLTCVEMCDAMHPPEALCGPEGLLRQVKEAAAEAGVEVGGENALPCFSHLHIDAAGLDRIVYNSQAWGPPLQEEAAKEEALYNRPQDPNAESSQPSMPSIPPLPDAVKLGFMSDPRFARSGKLLQGHLPKMRGLTFLRLAPEMMGPNYQSAWIRFMHRMQNLGAKPR